MAESEGKGDNPTWLMCLHCYLDDVGVGAQKECYFTRMRPSGEKIGVYFGWRREGDEMRVLTTHRGKAGVRILQFQTDDWIESIISDRAFLHFRLNTKRLFREVLGQVHSLAHATESHQPEYGTNNSGRGKKVIIEYSSPNIAKDFHAGHLRSTIIGAFLANLYKACGWEVISMNYLGDWGTQFGLVAYGFDKYGSPGDLEKDPIKHLLEIYVKANNASKEDPSIKVEAAKWFKRMEDGDETVLKNWRVWRELSVKKYKKEYERLNVHFDVYTGESEVGKESIDRTLTRLEEKGLITEADGAKLVDLEKWKLAKTIVRKKNGTSVYLARDIGGAQERYDKYKFDKMIYVISSQQDMHMSQFLKILELLELPWAKSVSHINYGLVEGMSTRNGTAVLLNQIIAEAASVMHEQMQKNEEKYKAVEDPQNTALEVGMTGIKIQDMAAKRIHNYPFSWDRMTSFEGDPLENLLCDFIHLPR